MFCTVTVSKRPESPAALEAKISPPVSSTKPGFHFGVKDIPLAIKSLLYNGTFMSLNLAGASESMCFRMQSCY